MNQQPIFEARGLFFSTILQDINFTVAAGSLVTIIGSSGSGKSSILRLLNALQAPDRGMLAYAGTPLEQWDVLELRKKVRMVFQTPTMLPGTVRENLTYTQHLYGKQPRDFAEVTRLLQALGLPEEILGRSADDLSGGQKARVALGRAIYDRPPVLLCDELTASLDQESKRLIEEFVKSYQQEQGATCFWVTHDRQQARSMGDVTWVVDQGRLIEAGPTEQVFASRVEE